MTCDLTYSENPENNGIGRRHYSNSSVFDGVTKQIILPNTYKITFTLQKCFMVIELYKVKT